MNPTKNKFALLFLVILVCSSVQVFGLSSDRQKPMSIKSNQVYIDDKSGFSIYQGRVIVVQGTMKITAEKLTIVYDKNQRLKKIIAIGYPSTYTQRPDNKEHNVHAKANKMVYFALKDILVMTKNATIERGGGKIISPKIFYYLNEDRVDTGTSDKQKNQVNIIIDSNEKK